MLCSRSASFTEQDAHVLGDGQDELAQVLGLAKVVLGKLQLGELGDALDQFGDLGPEQLLDPLSGGVGVLDDVVQQRRDDGFGVEAVVGEDAGHLDRDGRNRGRRRRASGCRAGAWRRRRRG
jgi:hypothetical protein